MERTTNIDGINETVGKDKYLAQWELYYFNSSKELIIKKVYERSQC